jgi:FlaA1/EpsC-like NDP-sugar epimerase
MSAFDKIKLKLKSLSIRQKVLLVLLADFVVLNTSVFVAYMLRLSAFELPPADKKFIYFVAPILSVIAAYAFGVYSIASRNYSHSIERKLTVAQIVATLSWAFLLVFFGTVGFARSVVIIYSGLAVISMIVLRRLASMVFNVKERRSASKHQIPVIIYGAGREGMMLADSLRRNGRYRPVAFLDTDYTLVDRVVSGLKVFPMEKLQAVIEKFVPAEAIVAKPELTRANRRVLVEMLIDRGLIVKTAPGLDEIIDGQVKIGDIRPIRVEDLLGRDPVPPDQLLMDRAVKNQVVMVTGAGGSIGSELVRQAAQFAARKIILVENNEFALFEIHREMEAKNGRDQDIELVPVLLDVKDKQHLDLIMKMHSVDVVFHAAAYKHVRMVQDNASAGICNNVFGTRAVAEAALENKVKRFILISTDKAVRPTSIMGASKRVAEMVVQALAAEKNHETIFSMVRFGNVLGSTGSVVPLFREQISAGGPVTVTHPEVTRYFMLIPEAAQLVMQAGAMAEGGEVFVLDMGDPIKIVHLAETMIELAGLTRKTEDNPEGDIEVIFSGLKEGEKLYEELQIGDDISTTIHPRIMKSRELMLELAKLTPRLEKFKPENGALNDPRMLVKHVFEIAN